MQDLARFDGVLEPALQAVAELARSVFGTSGALVALVDATRHRTLAADGPLALPPDLPRAWTPCDLTIRTQGAFVLPDLLADARFRSSPLVQEGVRFYAGAPLRTPEGLCLGTVAIISEQPRPDGLSEADQLRLHHLADVAMAALETRRARHAFVEAVTLVPPPRLSEAAQPRAARPGRPALAADIVARVRALRQAGGTMAQIAARLGIAVSSVHKVLRAPQATSPSDPPAPWQVS